MNKEDSVKYKERAISSGGIAIDSLHSQRSTHYRQYVIKRDMELGIELFGSLEKYDAWKLEYNKAIAKCHEARLSLSLAEESLSKITKIAKDLLWENNLHKEKLK